MPRFVTILTQRVGVRRAAEIDISDSHGKGATAFGCYESHVPLITIATQGRERERHTFLHENIHAMIDMSKLHESSDEEDFVSRFSPVLLAWLRENPTAVAYLQEAQS